VTGDSRDIGGTPTFRAGRLNPKTRLEEIGDALHHLKVAHLNFDYGIRQPAVLMSDE
jgi:hypothetical protein